MINDSIEFAIDKRSPGSLGKIVSKDTKEKEGSM